MALSDELAAREKRTLGVFALMSGAGLVLDHGPVTLAVILLIIGLVLFVWGLSTSRRRAARTSLAAPSETPQ
jgi:hypothetical protein